MTDAFNIYRKRSIKVRIFVFAILVLSFLGCNQNVKEKHDTAIPNVVSDSATKELRSVSFLPDWMTNAQFAGYYVAEAKGIYKKFGIRLNIIPYQPFITTTELIKSGKVDFSSLWLSNALELRASGTEVVNITQLSSRSSLMLITKKRSGINSIREMDGKKAGIWDDNELQPRALFKKYNVDVKIIPIGSTNNLFLMDGVDIINASWYDEYHNILNAGINPEELNTFFFADHGMNFVEEGIYCLSSKLKKDSKLCEDFVKATIEGWRYAFSNPEEAIDIVINCAKKQSIEVNRPHQKWMLDRCKDLYLLNGKTGPGILLQRQDYEFLGNILKESGLIKTIPDYSDFYQPVVVANQTQSN